MGLLSRTASLLRNVFRRARVERELDEELQFHLEQKIEAAQRRICERLGFDLSSLWQWSADDPDDLVLTHVAGCWAVLPFRSG